MSRGSTPRHALTTGDLGLTLQFNAETPWHFAQLHYSPQSNNRKGNSIQMGFESYTQSRYSPWLVTKQSLELLVHNTPLCRVLRIGFHLHIVLQARVQPASL